LVIITDDSNQYGKNARFDYTEACMDLPVGEHPVYTAPPHPRVEVTEAFEQECGDVDKILLKLGLEPDSVRTQGGYLMVPRILNHIQETLDALAQATNFGAEMSDKYCAYVKDHPSHPRVEVTDEMAGRLLLALPNFKKYNHSEEEWQEDKCALCDALKAVLSEKGHE
jgi:hypothetical protein